MCLDNNGTIDFETIKGLTNWNNNIIEMAIVNSENIIKLGNSKCAIFERLFKDEERLELKKIIKEDMKGGYTTINRIYSKLFVDESGREFVSRNNIESSKELLGVIKALDNNIGGHNVVLYYEDQEIKSVNDIIYNRYPEKIYRKNISDTLDELGMIKGNMTHIIDTFLLERRYVQISRNEYIKYDLFEVEEDLVKNILSFFTKTNYENGYVIPQNHFPEITRRYTDNGYGWNQYTVSAILTRNGYKQLKRYNAPYRYETLVLVKEEVEYDDISFLIYDILKNEYHGELHEMPIYEFLSEKGIYKKRERIRLKKLPLDATEKGMISADIKGNVTLKA